jgi:ribulose-5-phosphate 4-epimerase/fuculose-1-phosphate aldolase
MTADGLERAFRGQLVALGASLFGRRLTFGRTGNLSVRVSDHLLVTPTGSSLGGLDPGQMAMVGMDGSRLGGAAPSKEAFLHTAMYRARPRAGAVVHLHSTYAAADAIQELEETAKLFLLLHGQAIRPLTDDQAERLCAQAEAKAKETR